MNNGTDSIAELFQKYGDEVFRTCLLILKNREAAEDAAMETYLRAMRTISGFCGGSSEKTWLIRIAVNLCKDTLRSPAVRRNLGSEPLESLAGRDEYAARDDRLTVSAAIGALKPIYREAAVLCFYNGFTVKEAARLAGVPQTAMAYRVRRARELLRESLGAEYFGEDPQAGERRASPETPLTGKERSS
ncbi:MAG: RNA polymerase sigma factor [Bacteroides sp.]|nr:RNA polymerase sigma factor [Eubacterium sp.]MCM1418443.1 RNA polymerase sigma factor [Roseburia sp.]MCM1462039.1 RNA polymerase sigma factor [Bacteroides sp.]